MFIHKKIAACLMSFLICASACAGSVYSTAFADEESITGSESNISESASESEDDYITSGDYKYSITSDGSACLEDYIGSAKDVTIPSTIDGKNVTELGNLAFFEKDIVSVHIPAGINYIADNPFMESTSLKEITVDENNEYYFAQDGILYLVRNGKNTLLCFPQGKETDSFSVPDTVSEIGVAALYGTKITKIILPSSISYIYHHSMSYNENLTSVDMSKCTSLSEIGEMSFSGCTALTEVAFPDTLTSIGAGAFAQCTALSEVTLPESLLKIGQNAFAATGLKKIQIPDSVTDIDYCAFGYDEDLNAIEDFVIIGASGSAAETYATDTDEDYNYENNFTFVDSANADLIDESANFETKTNDEYVYTDKDGEIYILSCLITTPTIEIPAEIDGNPVTCIYGSAFYGNQASSIIIPDTVTKIGKIAFADCSSLTEIKLPDSLKQIDNQAFAGCSKLKSIEIPASCETIGEEAFFGCSAIEKFTVQKGSEYFCSEDGVLFNKDKTSIIDYPTAKDDKYYKVPESVAEICASAFAGNNFLEHVDISSVITIGDYAFENCSNLSIAKLSPDLDTIGTCAFYNCTSLLSMRTYNNLTKIGAYAIGYRYDSSDSENDGDTVIDEFIIYADEGSGGAQYAAQNKITCENDVSKYQEGKAPAETVEIFGVKVEKVFLYVVGGILAAVIIAAAGFFISKKVKKNKEDKAYGINGKDDKNEVK